MVEPIIHSQRNASVHKHNFILALTVLIAFIRNILISTKRNAWVVHKIKSMILKFENVLTVHFKNQNLMEKSVYLVRKILIGISLCKHALNALSEGFTTQHRDYASVQLINFSLVLTVLIVICPNILIFRKCNVFNVLRIKLMI